MTVHSTQEDYIRLTHLDGRLCIRHTYALSKCFYKTIVDQAPRRRATHKQASASDWDNRECYAWKSI